MTNMVETGIYTGVVAVLIWAAATDLKSRRIPNIQPLLVLALFLALVATRLTAGDGFLGAAAWPLVAAFVVFAFGAILFALRLIGGGDVKLMAAVALVAGPAFSASFIFFVALAGGVVALATLVHTHTSQPAPSGPPKVPYGVAIMASGVWICLQKISIASA